VAWNFVNRYLTTAPPSSDVHDIVLPAAAEQFNRELAQFSVGIFEC
jgi:hypothetical protein